MRWTVLVLPVPPSANRYWRSAVVNGHVQTYVSEEGKAYREEVRHLAKLMRLEKFTVPTRMKIEFFRGAQMGDVSNRVKVLEDVLQGIAYEDDAQNVEVLIRRREDPANPRVEVVIDNDARMPEPEHLHLPDWYADALVASRARLDAVRASVRRQGARRAAKRAAKKAQTHLPLRPRFNPTPNVVRPR